MARCGMIALILAVVFYVPLIIVLTTAGIELTNSVMLLGALFLLAIMLAPAAWINRSLWRQLGARILVFTDGIVYMRRHQKVAYRWDDLQKYYYWGFIHTASVFGVPTWHVDTQYHYRFCHRDGNAFEFSEKLERKDDLPLAAYVEKGLFECELPRLRQQFFEEQDAVVIEPFVLEQEGLRYGRGLLPWMDAEYVWAEDGQIRARRRGKAFNWCSVKMRKVSKSCLLIALAKERIDQQEANPR